VLCNQSIIQLFRNDSVGTLGSLDKTRYLFIHEGRTRLHLDIVKNNGSNYYGMEFEVMLKENESLDFGNEIAEKLMQEFKLNKDQLLEGSYFEILNASN
jgi:adenylate cyclase class IV